MNSSIRRCAFWRFRADSWFTGGIRLLSTDAGSRASFQPGESEGDAEVAELTECEHCTAEYQAERSANITHQRQHSVRSLSLDVRVLQLREKYLRHRRQLYRQLFQASNIIPYLIPQSIALCVCRLFIPFMASSLRG